MKEEPHLLEIIVQLAAAQIAYKGFITVDDLCIQIEKVQEVYHYLEPKPKRKIFPKGPHP